MYRSLLAVLAVVSLGFVTAASGQEGDKASKDLKKLQGSWTVVSMEIKGQKLPEDKLKEADIKLVVKDGKYAQQVQGEIMEEGTFKLDPSKKPAAIDLSIDSGNDKGKMQRGIYEIKGDTWRISFAKAGSKDRPTSFASNEDDDTAVMTLKRDKK
jgi:uncharacterized protein (TIGR03067 family)